MPPAFYAFPLPKSADMQHRPVGRILSVLHASPESSAQPSLRRILSFVGENLHPDEFALYRRFLGRKFFPKEYIRVFGKISSQNGKFSQKAKASDKAPPSTAQGYISSVPP